MAKKLHSVSRGAFWGVVFQKVDFWGHIVCHKRNPQCHRTQGTSAFPKPDVVGQTPAAWEEGGARQDPSLTSVASSFLEPFLQEPHAFAEARSCVVRHRSSSSLLTLQLPHEGGWRSLTSQTSGQEQDLHASRSMSGGDCNPKTDTNTSQRPAPGTSSAWDLSAQQQPVVSSEAWFYFYE